MKSSITPIKPQLRAQLTEQVENRISWIENRAEELDESTTQKKKTLRKYKWKCKTSGTQSNG